MYYASHNGLELSDNSSSNFITSSEILYRGIKIIPRRLLTWGVSLMMVAITILLVAGCVPGATVARMDGFNIQWRGFDSLKSEYFAPYETEIQVKVIVVSQLSETGYPGAAATYSHPQGIIRILGKMINGKLVLCPSVIGHEFQHALEYQDGHFANPDKLAEYGY